MIELKGVDDLRFIYVTNPKDKAKLESLGYNLLKADRNNSIYIFENKANINFELDDSIQYVLSDTLSF